MNENGIRSMAEEVIAGIWMISAILCFYAGYNIAAWIFLIKSILDILASIGLAIKSIKQGKNNGK